MIWPLLILCCVTIVHAGHTFISNCTIPDVSVTYSAGPNARGTLTILWTSLATIVACVYTVLHLNVPEARRINGRGWKGHPGWKGHIYWSAKNTSTSLMYALVTIIIPELMLSKSIADLRLARQNLNYLHEARPETKDSWTIQHMLYAGMGGFYASYDGDYAECDNTATGYVNYDDLYDGGGLARYIDEFDDAGQAKYAATRRPRLRRYFVGHDLIQPIKDGVLRCNPPLTNEELADKSKTDFTGKIVAMTQISYFVLSTIIRGIKSLAVSPLELAACAFVPYAIALYIISYFKPKSPRTSTQIYSCFGNLPPSLDPASSSATDDENKELYSVWLGLGLLQSDNRSFRRPLPNDVHGTSKDVDDQDVFTLLVALSIPFGAIHLAAWNFNFPTSIDSLLWKISALIVTGSLPCVTLLAWLLSFLTDPMAQYPERAEKKGLLPALLLLPLIGFFSARLVIIVEMFRTLAFLPPSSFISTWTSGISHLA